MTSESPSPELIQQAIENHLAPTILFKVLPRALEILAHAALLASKLSEEISRILEAAKQRGDFDQGQMEVLEGWSTEALNTSASLWKVSVLIRLHHVAAVLAPNKKFSTKILSLIECYFPEGRDRSSYTYKSSRLFIRAMPTGVHREYQMAGETARSWYREASERSPDDLDGYGARHRHSDKAYAADLAGEAINSARAMVHCIREVETLLHEDTQEVVKDGVKPEIRQSRSPSPGHLSKVPQLTFNRVKKRISSARVSSTPVTPTVQPQARLQPRIPDPLGSERTTSLMETEAVLDLTKSEDEDEDEHKAALSGDDAKQMQRPKGVLKKETPKSETKQTSKKRFRPSFPPREGPDYTAPLPRAGHKKLRIFSSADLKR